VKDEIVRNLKTSEEVESWTMALLIRLTLQQALLSNGEQPKTSFLETLLKGIN